MILINCKKFAILPKTFVSYYKVLQIHCKVFVGDSLRFLESLIRFLEFCAYFWMIMSLLAAFQNPHRFFMNVSRFWLDSFRTLPRHSLKRLRDFRQMLGGFLIDSFTAFVMNSISEIPPRQKMNFQPQHKSNTTFIRIQPSELRERKPRNHFWQTFWYLQFFVLQIFKIPDIVTWIVIKNLDTLKVWRLGRWARFVNLLMKLFDRFRLTSAFNLDRPCIHVNCELTWYSKFILVTVICSILLWWRKRHLRRLRWSSPLMVLMLLFSSQRHFKSVYSSRFSISERPCTGS